MGGKRKNRGKLGADDAEHAAQIDQIITDVTHQYRAGLNVDIEAIKQQHPHLMPELGDRLRLLRAIEEARRKAGQQHESPGAVEGFEIGADEDLRVLRKALDGYEILERLHYGGQGVVYKALQLKTGRFVAIKVLLFGPLSTPQQRHRFDREVRLMSRVKHPNIVTLHDSGVVRGLPYLVMEYVEGGLPIDRYVILQDMTVHEMVEFFATVCRAVNSAHQQGVIHRDLKPSNILVDTDGKMHVLDFGLAKDIWQADSTDGRVLHSLTVGVVGTLPYLSPEQADGSGQIDTRSDVYSLGVVLFHLLTGDFPYPVEGATETVRSNIIAHEPVRLRKALGQDELSRPRGAGQINADLEAILLKALEKERSRRYQSALEFAEDLERFVGKEAVRAQGSRHLYILGKTMRRYRIPLGLAAAFLIVVGALAGELLRLAMRIEAVDAAGRQQVQNAQVSNVDVLRLYRDAQAKVNHLDEFAEMPPALAERHLQRYQKPAVEPDERFERIAENKPPNLLESIQDSDEPSHESVVSWLKDVGDELDSTAATLQTTSIRVPLEEGTALAMTVDGQAWSSIESMCEVFLVRAYLRRATGNDDGALADLTSIRHLALDLGDGVTLAHKNASITWRHRTYVFIRAAITDALRSGQSVEEWVNWLEADPLLVDLGPALVHAGLATTQLLNASFLMDSPSAPAYLDLDRLNELTDGYLDEVGALTPDTRSQARSYRKEDADELVEHFINCARHWGELTYSELEQAVVTRDGSMIEAREHNPALYIFPEIGIQYRARLQTTALRRALKVVAAAARLRDVHGRWPQNLSEDLNLTESSAIIEPMTGEEFVYQVIDGLPCLRSVSLEAVSKPHLLIDETSATPILASSGVVTYFPSPVTP